MNSNKNQIINKVEDISAFSEESSVSTQEIASSSSQITKILTETAGELKFLNSTVIELKSMVSRFIIT